MKQSQRGLLDVGTFPSESHKAETKSGTCPYLLPDPRVTNEASEKGWLSRPFSPREAPPSCGVTDSCLRNPLRYIWKRECTSPRLICSVATHCATYSSNVLLPSGEMHAPPEKQNLSATLHWPEVSCQAEWGPVHSLHETERACHGAGVRDAREESDGRELGSAALIPAFPCTAFPGRLLASPGCLTAVACGSATPVLNPSDFPLFACIPVGSDWQQSGIFNPDSTPSAWMMLGK